MQTNLKNAVILALLVTPMAVWAQSHGGGPPSGTGGGPPSGFGGGPPSGFGGGPPSGVGGGGNGSGYGAGNSRSPFESGIMSSAREQRAEAKARRAEAKAKAEAAEQAGAEHADDNAAFGQGTAARARTLKDADNATRTGFGSTVASGAKLQGGSHVATSSTTRAGAMDSSQAGSEHANANADFGQLTAADAKSLKDSDNATRTQFGTSVKTRAAAKVHGKSKGTHTDGDGQ